MIKHIFCEASKSADALAQIGVDQQEVLEIYEDPPSSIRPFLVADLVGLVYERD